MPFADILYEYLCLLFSLTIINLIWCFGGRLYRKRKFSHMELEPLRSEVIRALLTSVLAPVIVMMIRALTSWIAGLL